MARAWKRNNPEAYAAVLTWAREDVAHGVRPAIDLYVNLLRRPHFALRLGMQRTDSVYLLNNNLRAELSRLVMEEHPELVFETRRSRADLPGGMS